MKEITYTPAEVANILGICQGLLAPLVMNKLIPYSKAGNTIQFKKSNLDQWTEEMQIVVMIFNRLDNQNGYLN